jgi:type II secretory pathway pseudopilin PulG
MARLTAAGNSQRGFTYLAVLITVATMGGALAAAGQLSSHAAQREKEAELLFIGEQYRQAIASYYERSPGGAKRYPQRLEDMLEDKRMPVVRRHLRKLYADPVTGQPMATMEAPGGGIMGVFSPSEAAPVKTGNFSKRDGDLADAASYAQWKFFYQPEALKPIPGDAPSTPTHGPNGLPASHPRNTGK